MDFRAVSNTILDLFGNNVYIRVKTITISPSGDEYEEYNDYLAIAGVNDITPESDYYKAGEAFIGEKLFFFNSEAEYINENNTIIFNSEEYKIKKIIKHYSSNILAGYEVLAKKI